MTFRNLLVLTSCALVTLSMQAQTSTEEPLRTLIGGQDDLHHGGWGAPTTHYTRVMDKDALLVGLRGGWLINHRVTIGLAGQGLVTPIANPAYDAYLVEHGELLQPKSTFYMGYGGLLIEPIIAYASPVHVSLPLIIGAGGCGYGYKSRYTEQVHDFDYREDMQAFFVVEPGVELEMNLIPLVRLGVGASYRYTTDIDLPETSADALRGFNAGVSIKIGRF